MTGRIIRILCGFFLLSSVLLKTEGLAEGSHEASVIPAELRLAATEVELIVGLWLVSGWSRNTGRLVAIVLFAGLAAVSLYMLVNGEAACGCFGRIRVHPRWTLLFDLVCCGLLTVGAEGRPMSGNPGR